VSAKAGIENPEFLRQWQFEKTKPICRKAGAKSYLKGDYGELYHLLSIRLRSEPALSLPNGTILLITIDYFSVTSVPLWL